MSVLSYTERVKKRLADYGFTEISLTDQEIEILYLTRPIVTVGHAVRIALDVEAGFSWEDARKDNA